MFSQEIYNMFNFNAGNNKNSIEKIIGNELTQISDESYFIDNWPVKNSTCNFYINQTRGLWAFSQIQIIENYDSAMRLFENIFDEVIDNYGKYNIIDIDGSYTWIGEFVNNIWKIKLKKTIMNNYILILRSVEFNNAPNYKNIK
jgi:hypothetical protein